MGSLVGGSLVKSKRGRGTDGRADGRKIREEIRREKNGGGGKRTDGPRGRWWVVFCVNAKVLRTYGSLRFLMVLLRQNVYLHYTFFPAVVKIIINLL